MSHTKFWEDSSYNMLVKISTDSFSQYGDFWSDPLSHSLPQAAASGSDVVMT